jgi:hypothetical protein
VKGSFAGNFENEISRIGSLLIAASFSPTTEVSTEGLQVKICTDVMELARVG